jgi:hypothetical protein
MAKHKGFQAKYPFVNMRLGDVVSFVLESPVEERRLRNAAANANTRFDWHIRGRKIADDVITFTRLK